MTAIKKNNNKDKEAKSLPEKKQNFLSAAYLKFKNLGKKAWLLVLAAVVAIGITRFRCQQ